MAVRPLGYGEHQIVETATQEASYGELQYSQAGIPPNLHGSIFGTISGITSGELRGWASLHGALSANLSVMRVSTSLQGLVDAVVAQISARFGGYGSGTFTGNVTGDGLIDGQLPRMMVGSVWNGRVTHVLTGDLDATIKGIRGVNYHGRLMGWMRGISGGLQAALTSYADELPKRPHKPGAVFLIRKNGRSRQLAKQPSENRLFQFNLNDLLASDETVAEVLSVVAVPASLSFSDPIISGDRVWYRIAGGAAGQICKITLKVRTSTHPVLEVDVQLAIIER